MSNRCIFMSATRTPFKGNQYLTACWSLRPLVYHHCTICPWGFFFFIGRFGSSRADLLLCTRTHTWTPATLGQRPHYTGTGFNLVQFRPPWTCGQSRLQSGIWNFWSAVGGKKTEELLEIYGQEQVIFPVWGNDRPTMLWQEGITEYLTPTRRGVGVGGCTHRAECTFTCAGKNGTVFCLFRGQHSFHPGHEITI